jgi:hypothetical protein
VQIQIGNVAASTSAAKQKLCKGVKGFHPFLKALPPNPYTAKFGVAELRYERLNYNISESPLNPPILGDFEVRRPPELGVGGRIHT